MESKSNHGIGIDGNWDLTPVMAPFFDVHMLVPLLDHLRENGVYDSKTISKQKAIVFSNTNMIELIQEELDLMDPSDSMLADPKFNRAHLEARTNQIFDRIDNETPDVQTANEFFSNEEVIAELKANVNLTIEYITNHSGINVTVLDNYYKFAKFKFDCGMYSDAEEMLSNYLSVVQQQNSTVLGALWGRLACRILQAKWDDALIDFSAVKEAIESRSIAPIDQIRQRAWLMHWGLFVFLNQQDGPDALVEFYSEKYYMQTLENLCPWLIRYYVAAILLAKKRKSLIKDCLNEIQAVAYMYSDPITEFVESLYEVYDFDDAHSRLENCMKILKLDFFLQVYSDRIRAQARLIICEIHCAISHKIDLRKLSTLYTLTEEEAEKWIVDMIRNISIGESTLNAIVDSAEKQVIVSPPTNLVHQSIANKTKDLIARSEILNINLEQLLQEQALYIRKQLAASNQVAKAAANKKH